MALPVYNESQTVETIVLACLAVLERATTGFREVLLVDDGSDEPTAGILRDLAERLPNVRLFVHPLNRGFAAVQRSCYEQAQGEWVFLLPADGQIAPETLLDFLPLSPAHALVLGVADKNSRDRRFTSRFYHHLVRRLFSLPYGDYGACLLARRSLAAAVATSATTPVAMTALVVEAQRRGLPIAEVAVCKRPRQGGVSKGASVWRTAPTIALDLAVLYRATRCQRKKP